MICYQISAVLQTNFPRYASSLLRGKRTKHTLEIIAALAVLGQSTTREIAKFVLKHSPDNPYKPKVRDREARITEQIYYKLIHGRFRKQTGRRRSSEKYRGLLDETYLVYTGVKENDKKRKIATYFLTLKGCFFVLGFNFPDQMLRKFIKNASFNHLYFAYLDRLCEKLPFGFVKEIFLTPIQNMISRGVLVLDNVDIDFYFSVIAESHSGQIRKKLDTIETIYQKRVTTTRKPYNRKKILDYSLIEKLYKLTPQYPQTIGRGDMMVQEFYNENFIPHFYIVSDRDLEIDLAERVIDEINDTKLYQPHTDQEFNYL